MYSVSVLLTADITDWCVACAQIYNVRKYKNVKKHTPL